jgi:Plasmid pRiA4b ORF-3-like protein
MPESSVSSRTIYQLRVVLCGVSPLVWRRLLLASDTSLAELHAILQHAFAWSDEHLHRFLIHAAYGVPRLGGLAFRDDARRVPLSRFRLHRGERFRYEYDFTADWKLDLRLERTLPFDPKRGLPSCIGGSRAAPPESCAGAWAYLQRLDEHKSHLPLEGLSLLAEAMQRFLDSEGDRHTIGDLDELGVPLSAEPKRTLRSVRANLSAFDAGGSALYLCIVVLPKLQAFSTLHHGTALAY